jgi:RimJ/RimL family protein N-acetyltransferase
LIGEKKWRGKGVAQETISELTKTLNKDLQINKFYLGVDRDNSAAIRAYTKMGFCWESDKTMSLELKDLIKTIDI